MVIDNNSQDESTEYLKSLDWIDLVERKDEANDSSGGYAHVAALDMGLERCETEYFMSMHSDAFVHKDGWLEWMMSNFLKDDQVVCVGCGKCELTSRTRELIKKLSDFKTLKRKILRTPDPDGIYRYYNRTVATIYKKETLVEQKLNFMLGRDKGYTAGKKLYFELKDRGFKTVELSDSAMKDYIWHLAHATQVINKQEFNIRGKTQKKIIKRINKIWNTDQVRKILQDDSLDK